MKSRAMLTALLVSYADRLAAFGMPFLMLQFGGGSDVFVRVEYIISVSVIVATFADAGLRNYVLYHFGRNHDVGLTTLLTARAALVVLILQSLLVAAALAAAHVTLPAGPGRGDLPLGVLRGVALAVIGVATQIFIIHERPLTGIFISLCSWLIGGIALLLPEVTPPDLRVLVFFTSTFLVMLLVPALLWRITRLRRNREGIEFAMKSLGWGWPILVAAASSIAVAQIARIYGLSTFDTHDATAFAFWMRIFSIVQLSHRAAIMMISRRIFAAEGTGIFPEILRSYLQMLVPAIMLGFGAAITAPWVNGQFAIKLPLLDISITTMIGLQATFWCLAALMELYFSREDQVHYVMVASGLPALAFVLFLVFSKVPDLLMLASAMAGASLAQLVLLILFRRYRLRAARAHSTP